MEKMAKKEKGEEKVEKERERYARKGGRGGDCFCLVLVGNLDGREHEDMREIACKFF
jgi:hypothetical protein